MKTSPLFSILAALVLATGVALPISATDPQKNQSELNGASSGGTIPEKEDDGSSLDADQQQTLRSDQIPNDMSGGLAPDFNPAKQFQSQYNADQYQENKHVPFNLLKKLDQKTIIILALTLLFLFIVFTVLFRMKYTSKSTKKGLQRTGEMSHPPMPALANQVQADAKGQYKNFNNTVNTAQNFGQYDRKEIAVLKGEIAVLKGEIAVLKGEIAKLKILSSSISSQGNYGDHSILPVSGGQQQQPHHEVQSEIPSIDEGVLRGKCEEAVRAVRKCSDPDEYEADLRAIGDLRSAYDASGGIRISASYSEDPSAQIVAVMLNDRSVIILPSCDYIRNFSGNANVHVAPMEIRLSYQLEPTGECSLGIEQVTIGVVNEDNIVDDMNKGLLRGFTGDTSL